MIDLHAHILPGLDDGSQSMEDSLLMAELAVEGGVDILVATPHSNQEERFENYNSFSLRASWREMREAVEREKLPLQLLLGMEIMASEDVAEKIADGRLIGLNGTDYYLVEFPFESDPYWVGDRLEEILDCGKTPLIAHPERYVCVQEYPGLLYEWLQMGCRSQANKGSLLGRFGRRVGQTLEILLESRLITCIASDAHSPYMRTTYMGDARDYLEDHYGYETAHALMTKNPETILRGERIRPHGEPPRRKRRFFI